MSQKPSDKKLTIVVIVNGVETSVEISENAALASLIAHALQQTGNTGQPPDNWNLTTAQGAPLSPNKSAADCGLTTGTKLFLNLKAGQGGS